MRFELLRLATKSVRAWTRVYTFGLPPAERAARVAEIDSDLWEFEHDPEVQPGGWAAAQILARLLIGIPDDLAWRMHFAAAQTSPVRAPAAAGEVTGPRRLSAFGLSATVHVMALAAATWLPWHGAVAAPGPEAGPAQARIEHIAPIASLWNRLVSHEHENEPVMTMTGRSGPSRGNARASDLVGAVAVAAGARLGSTKRSLSAAQRPFSASGPSTEIPEPSSSRDGFAEKILQSRYSLSVRNGRLAGTGAPVLLSAIAGSRFVLLGEDHGVAQTPELGAAVCRAAGPVRFQALAIEEGPLAAGELEKWARRPDGLSQLAVFQRRFPDSINVYTSREEFAMLQQCARAAQGEFHLWGLNQEALGGGRLILSRILESRLGEAARPAMRQLLQKNDDAHSRALKSGRIADLFMLSADSRDLAEGAAVLQRDGSREARLLFASLIESHEINRTSPANEDSARRRERLMKTRFAAEYAQAAKGAATPPRVLLKFGAHHVYRGTNPVGGHGIGNYVADFAERQGAHSLHVRLISIERYRPLHPRVGQPAQLRPVNIADDPRFHYLQPMLSHRLESGWTLFDLRPLRQHFSAEVRAANRELATLVSGFDLLVIVPEGTPSTKIH